MITVCIPTINNDTDLAVLYQQLQCQKNMPKDVVIYIADNSKTKYAQRIVQRYQWSLETVIDPYAEHIMPSWNHAIDFRPANVIFLNDDLLIPEDFLSRMQRAFDDGHVCVNPDAPGFPPRRSVRSDYKWPTEGNNQEYYLLRDPIDPLLPTLKGWCFGMSQELIAEVGHFDPQFKIWYGDTDMDRRIIKKHPITFIKELFVNHFGSTSSLKIDREEFGIENIKNQLAFENKHGIKHVDRGVDKYLEQQDE